MGVPHLLHHAGAGPVQRGLLLQDKAPRQGATRGGGKGGGAPLRRDLRGGEEGLSKTNPRSRHMVE